MLPDYKIDENEGSGKAKPAQIIAKWVAGIVAICSGGATVYGLFSDKKVTILAFMGMVFALILLFVVQRAAKDVNRRAAKFYGGLVKILVAFVVLYFIVLSASIFPALRAWLINSPSDKTMLSSTNNLPADQTGLQDSTKSNLHAWRMSISLRPFTNFTAGIALSSTNVFWSGTKTPPENIIAHVSNYISNVVSSWWPRHETDMHFTMQKIVTNRIKDYMTANFFPVHNFENIFVSYDGTPKDSSIFETHFWMKLPSYDSLKCFPDSGWFSLRPGWHPFAPGFIGLSFKQHISSGADFSLDLDKSFEQVARPGYRSAQVSAGMLLALYENSELTSPIICPQMPYQIVLEGIGTDEAIVAILKQNLSRIAGLQVYGHDHLVNYCRTFQIPEEGAFQSTNHFRFMQEADRWRYDELKVDAVVELILSDG